MFLSMSKSMIFTRLDSVVRVLPSLVQPRQSKVQCSQGSTGLDVVRLRAASATGGPPFL
jgi:hypothetical protein